MTTFTTQEVADRHGYHVKWVRHLIRQGKLTAHKRGRFWVIESTSLDRYIRNLPAGKRRGRKPKKGRSNG